MASARFQQIAAMQDEIDLNDTAKMKPFNQFNVKNFLIELRKGSEEGKVTQRRCTDEAPKQSVQNYMNSYVKGH